MPKTKTEHVRWLPPSIFFCAHCGDHYEMAMPAAITVLSGAMKGYSKIHTACKLSRKGLACYHCFQFGHAPDKCIRLDYKGDLSRWWQGPDTGISSKGLCSKLTHFALYDRRDPPRDPSDFGRCYRFLNREIGHKSAIPALQGEVSGP